MSGVETVILHPDPEDFLHSGGDRGDLFRFRSRIRHGIGEGVIDALSAQLVPRPNNEVGEWVNIHHTRLVSKTEKGISRREIGLQKIGRGQSVNNDPVAAARIARGCFCYPMDILYGNCNAKEGASLSDNPMEGRRGQDRGAAR